MRTELPGIETLRYLAEHEPEALEQLRRELVEQLIDSAPPRLQRRLRGLQFQIDARRRLARTPLAACVVVSGMMHETLARLQQALNGWAGDPAPCPGHRARILRFPSRTH